MASPQLNAKQCVTLGKHFVPAKRRLLLKGAPGIGKTAVAVLIASLCAADLVVMHPSVGDPTDFKGAPWVVQTEAGPRAEFLPFGQLRELDEATRTTICFIDDLGQALPATQAAVMQMLDRYKGHPHVVFMAATNDRKHKAGVQGLLEPVKSRFDCIVEMVADPKSWAEWAQDSNVDPRLVAFLRDAKPGALHKWEPSVDIENQPCPRTWESVDAILKMTMPEDMRLVSMIGAVGEGAAHEIHSYLKMVEKCPTPEEIYADPVGTRIPAEVDLLYAVSAAVSHYATKQNFGAICTYAKRTYDDAQQGELAATMVADSFRRVGNEVASTPAFMALAKHPLGQMVIEAVKFNQKNGI